MAHLWTNLSFEPVLDNSISESWLYGELDENELIVVQTCPHFTVLLSNSISLTNDSALQTDLTILNNDKSYIWNAFITTNVKFVSFRTFSIRQKKQKQDCTQFTEGVSLL